MGWAVHLYDDRGHCEGEWSGTHNINGMIHAALADAGYQLPADPKPPGTISWWNHMHEMTGPDGAMFLTTIIDTLRADADKYKAMNPANGCGTYDGLLRNLVSMRDAVPEWPCTWWTTG